ncbi:MAG: PAS domain-containing protein [Nitrospirae bacterium]|nr:PAS domain-containing protein [Nitrospirota bacterium]
MGEIDLLNKAFSSFAEASRALEEGYKSLETQVRTLRLEVEEKNRALGLSLAETEHARMFLNNIIEGVPSAIIVFNSEGDILHHNSASRRLLGDPLPFENVLDLPFDISEGEVTIGSGAGAVSALITHSNVGDIGSLLVIQDITRLKELERQAEMNRRLAAMGELVAKIAHEIRNPLGSIELFASMLSNDLQGSPSKELADGISTGVQSLVNTLNNMLLYTRTRRIRRVPLDLAELVAESASSIRPLAARNGSEVLMDGVDGPLVIEGDGELIKQAIYNLSMNAVQAMPEGGVIRFGFDDSSDGYITLRVKDSGPGIPEEAMESIFEPFFSTKDRGNGLGLSIVKMIMKEHDGLIKVASVRGEGAEFSMIFPRREVYDA